MRRAFLALAVALAAAGGATPALAQKTAPPVTRDSDRDGVPDTRDRCRGTAANTRVDANGCPAPAAAPAQAALAPITATPPPPTPVLTPGDQIDRQRTDTARPAPPGPATAPAGPVPMTPAGPVPMIPGGALAGVAQQPAAAPGQPPAQQAAPSGGQVAAQPAAPPAEEPAVQPEEPGRVAPVQVDDPTLTAGFWMPGYGGSSEADKLEYARSLVLHIDSATVALVDVFRNTTGQPMAGASGPNVLSNREKSRWQRCRLLYFDFMTMTDAAAFLRDSIGGSPTVQRYALGLSDAFEAMQSIAECDNVASGIEAPDRWQPWGQNYETSARTFYENWYAQLRATHEAARTFARALNSVLPDARQFPLFPGISPTPPTIGAVR